jgi:hypothetical protein
LLGIHLDRSESSLQWTAPGTLLILVRIRQICLDHALDAGVSAVVTRIRVLPSSLLVEPSLGAEMNNHCLVVTVALRLVVLALLVLDGAAWVIETAALVPAPLDERMLVERGQIIGIEAVVVVLENRSFEEDFTLGVG